MATNMRPYQLPPAEQKLRDEKEAAERREHLEDLRKEAERPPRKKHRILRFFGWIFLIAILTAGLGYAGWYYLLREPMNEIRAEQNGNQVAAATPPPSSNGIKHYESTNFAMKFDYPDSWVVTDTAEKLTVISPTKKVAGNNVYGPQTVITIQPRQASTPAFKEGNATAIIASEKITYAKPSSTQRANSYLSFLNYASSTTKGLDGIYVTGDNGYQIGQAIPQVDIAKADPLITVTFNSCTNAACKPVGKPQTISQHVWEDQSFAKPIKNFLQSIVVE